MEYNFYPMNNKVLVLDPYNEKDIDYIRFNHYVMRKENLQRTKEELDRGLIKFSYISALNDLKISRRKLQRIVKWFEDNRIIECIEKSKARDSASVYAYTTVYYDSKSDTVCDTVCDTNSDINKPSNFNGFNSMSDTVCDTVYDINSDTSKKEKEKENRKRASIAGATSSSLACTGKVFKGKTKVKCKYNGATITATRFDALSHHYRKQENRYIEKNGFIYEISRGEAEKADRYKSNNSSIRVHDAFSTKKETDFEEITEQIQYF